MDRPLNFSDMRTNFFLMGVCRSAPYSHIEATFLCILQLFNLAALLQILTTFSIILGTDYVHSKKEKGVIIKHFRIKQDNRLRENYTI